MRDYDEAIRFYRDALGFELVEDERRTPSKRWVVVRPRGARGTNLLLAKAASPEQSSRVGNQTGGRVFLFLETDDIERDRARFEAAGVHFEEPIRDEPYGRVAVFRDLYGNRWDLLELTG